LFACVIERQSEKLARRDDDFTGPVFAFVHKRADVIQRVKQKTPLELLAQPGWPGL